MDTHLLGKIKMNAITTREKPTKKEKERHWLELFKVAYKGDFPAGTVKYDENPDVLIIDPAGTTGIEITEFHLIDGGLAKSEPQQALRRAGVLYEARDLYRTDGGKDILFHFEFQYISADRRKALPAEVAAFAKRNEDNIGKQIGLEGDAAPEEVSFAWNSGFYKAATLSNMQLYSGSRTSLDSLVKIIRSKERKVKGYQKCDAYWLLICVDYFDRAQDQEIQIDNPHVDSEVFDKIFMFRSAFNHIVPVKG